MRKYIRENIFSVLQWHIHCQVYQLCSFWKIVHITSSRNILWAVAVLTSHFSTTREAETVTALIFVTKFPPVSMGLSTSTQAVALREMTDQFFWPSLRPWGARQRVTPTSYCLSQPLGFVSQDSGTCHSGCLLCATENNPRYTTPGCSPASVFSLCVSTRGQDENNHSTLFKMASRLKKPVKQLATCSLQVTSLKLNFSTHHQVHLNISIPLMFILVKERSETFYAKTSSLHLGDSITSEEEKFHSQSLLRLESKLSVSFTLSSLIFSSRRPVDFTSWKRLVLPWHFTVNLSGNKKPGSSSSFVREKKIFFIRWSFP